MLTGDGVIRAVWEFAPMFRPTSNGSRRSRCGVAGTRIASVIAAVSTSVSSRNTLICCSISAENRGTGPNSFQPLNS